MPFVPQGKQAFLCYRDGDDGVPSSCAGHGMPYPYCEECERAAAKDHEYVVVSTWGAG